MSSVNKVILVGNLGADPEVKQFNNGGSLTNVVIATSEKYTNKQGEKVEETEWHRVSFFGKTGEIAAQYLRKGSKVYVEGAIKTRKYQAQDGTDRYATEIKGFALTMLGEASGQKPQGQQPRSETGLSPQQFNNQNNQAPNPYAQQVAQNAQGMQGQVSQQFANANQNPAMNGGGVVDQDIPFTKHFDGVM